MKFLAAIQFLTVIRLPRRLEVSLEDSGRSAGYFPVIGLFIGLILVSLNWIFNLILPPAVVNALLIAALVVISGALHLDGFVDTCDGLASNKSVEDRWKIMHDSRAGSFGIIGVVLLLLVKYASLNSIPAPLMMIALIIMPVVSRWAMVYAIFAYSYARPSGLGKAFKQGTTWPRLTMATLITLAITVALAQWVGLAVMFLVWVMTVAAAAYFKVKFSGLTGDTYGAINELAEVGVLILITLLVKLGLAPI